MLLASELDNLEEQIDSIKMELRRADRDAVSKELGPRRRAQRIKAFSIVWTCASFEDFFKSSLQSLILEVQSSVSSIIELAPCYMTLCHANHFESISDHEKTGHEKWKYRLDISREVIENTSPNLEPLNLPIDGSTVRSEHLSHVWGFFGFPRYHFPNSNQSYPVTMNSLADDRNDIAHGDTTPDEYGRNSSVEQIVRKIERIDTISVHICLSIENYLNNEDFLR